MDRDGSGWMDGSKTWFNGLLRLGKLKVFNGLLYIKGPKFCVATIDITHTKNYARPLKLKYLD
jgi:hypothetical protein